MQFLWVSLISILTVATSVVCAANVDAPSEPEIVWVTIGSKASDVTVHWISSDLQTPQSVVQYRWEKGFSDSQHRKLLTAVGTRTKLGTIGPRLYWVHHVPLNLVGIGEVMFKIPTSDRSWGIAQLRLDQAVDVHLNRIVDGVPMTADINIGPTRVLPIRVAIASDFGGHPDKLQVALTEMAKHQPYLVVLAGNILHDRGADDEAALAKWMELLQLFQQTLTNDHNLLPVLAVIPGRHDIDLTEPQSPTRAGLMSKLFPSIEQLPYSLTWPGALRLMLMDVGNTQAIAAQRQWLTQTASDPSFEGFTVPVYSESAYPAAKKFFSLGSLEVRRQWTRSFEDAGIPLAVEAYDRSYKRTQPLSQDQPATGGVVYIGGGGFARKDQDETAEPGYGGWMSNRRPYLAVSESMRHFIMLEVSEQANTLQLQAQAIADGGDAPGRVVDTVTVLKNQPATLIATFYAKPHQRLEMWLLIGFAVITAVFWLLYRRLRNTTNA